MEWNVRYMLRGVIVCYYFPHVYVYRTAHGDWLVSSFVALFHHRYRIRTYSYCYGYGCRFVSCILRAAKYSSKTRQNVRELFFKCAWTALNPVAFFEQRHKKERGGGGEYYQLILEKNKNFFMIVIIILSFKFDLRPNIFNGLKWHKLD